MAVEKGRQIDIMNTAGSGMFGVILHAPRGARSIKLTKLQGGFSMQSRSTTSHRAIIFMLRVPLHTGLASVVGLGEQDILWSQTIGQTTATEVGYESNGQVVDFDFPPQGRAHARSGFPNQGFQLGIEQDTSDLTMVGLFTTYYEIDWPDTPPTRNISRRRGMAVMNQ